MSLPTTATATVAVNAPADAVYRLVSDITRMGDWSPECVECTWLDEPGLVGSTFRGRNRRGTARWTTVAKVLVADPPHVFSFATLHRDQVSTRWTYRLEGTDTDTTMLSETFESVTAPPLITLAERFIMAIDTRPKPNSRPASPTPSTGSNKPPNYNPNDQNSRERWTLPSPARPA